MSDVQFTGAAEKKINGRENRNSWIFSGINVDIFAHFIN